MNLPALPPFTNTPTEWSEVERPLLLHLQTMDWTCESRPDPLDTWATGLG